MGILLYNLILQRLWAGPVCSVFCIRDDALEHGAPLRCYFWYFTYRECKFCFVAIQKGLAA